MAKANAGSLHCVRTIAGAETNIRDVLVQGTAPSVN